MKNAIKKLKTKVKNEKWKIKSKNVLSLMGEILHIYYIKNTLKWKSISGLR